MHCTGRKSVDVMSVANPRVLKEYHIPRLLFRDPEISRCARRLPETNVVFMPANELIAQGLETGKEERRRGREV